MRRYARVTTTMGGLAARVAGERYLGWDIDRAKHAADLRQALGGLKGPIMKVAQILSTIPDALPAEYADELAGLQADAPAMGWLFTKRRMASELGADWQQKFSQFEREAISAASLGQVHQAVGQNGEKLAVKSQYPDMQSAIEADCTFFPEGVREFLGLASKLFLFLYAPVQVIRNLNPQSLKPCARPPSSNKSRNASADATPWPGSVLREQPPHRVACRGPRPRIRAGGRSPRSRYPFPGWST
mgnify:CR=1 FL=1